MDKGINLRILEIKESAIKPLNFSEEMTIIRKTHKTLIVKLYNAKKINQIKWVAE